MHNYYYAFSFCQVALMGVEDWRSLKGLEEYFSLAKALIEVLTRAMHVWCTFKVGERRIWRPPPRRTFFAEQTKGWNYYYVHGYFLSLALGFLLVNRRLRNSFYTPQPQRLSRQLISDWTSPATSHSARRWPTPRTNSTDACSWGGGKSWHNKPVWFSLLWNVVCQNLCEVDFAVQ